MVLIDLNEFDITMNCSWWIVHDVFDLDELLAIDKTYNSTLSPLLINLLLLGWNAMVGKLMKIINCGKLR